MEESICDIDISDKLTFLMLFCPMHPDCIRLIYFQTVKRQNFHLWFCFILKKLSSGNWCLAFIKIQSDATPQPQLLQISPRQNSPFKYFLKIIRRIILFPVWKISPEHIFYFFGLIIAVKNYLTKNIWTGRRTKNI